MAVQLQSTQACVAKRDTLSMGVVDLWGARSNRLVEEVEVILELLWHVDFGTSA